MEQHGDAARQDEHEMAMDRLKNSGDAAHQEKDRKMERLKMFATLNTQQSTNQDDIADANRRKAEAALRLSHTAKRTEELHDEIRLIYEKISVCEDRNRETAQKQKEGDARIETVRKTFETALNDKFDVLACEIKAESESRSRLADEINQMVRLKEQKLKQCFLNELNEEANARKAGLNDVTQMAESIKDFRSLFDDEIAKMQGKMTTWAMKLKAQLSDASDLFNSERLIRERSIAAVKNDLDTKINDIKNIVETKVMQIDVEQDAALHKLMADVVLFEHKMEASKGLAQYAVDELETRCCRKLSELETTMTSRVAIASKELEDKIIGNSNRIVELKCDIKKENSDRKRNVNQIQESFAEEHLRREQDESAIIQMLETFMRQVKDMNVTPIS